MKFLLPSCLFILVLGAKWTTIRQFGSSVPEWDQWDAEGLHLLVPWFESHLTVADVFQPHNEHRVVLTKLQALALVLVNGQWDAELECLVNAALHSALAAGLFVLGRRHFAGRWQALLFVLLAALFGLPLAWQNVLGGFHSQQYYLLGLSVAAIALVPYGTAGSPAWWMGLACLGLALLSMASGFFAAAIVVGLLVWRWGRGAIPFRQAAGPLALGTGLCAVGWFTRVEVDYHAGLKAHSAAEFLKALALNLQWPAQGPLFLGAVVWAPWAAMTWRALRRPVAPPPAEGVLIGLGAWVWLQIAATAYARAGGGGAPASRYLDTLVIGIVVNALALAAAARRPRPERRRTSVVAGIAWIALVAHGIGTAAVHDLRDDLPAIGAYHARADLHVRDYLATGNIRHLTQGDIPYPSSEALVERLAHPALRDLMPPAVRTPLAVTAPAAAPFAEVPADDVGTGPGPQRLGRVFWSSFQAEPPASDRAWLSEPFPVRPGRRLQFRIAGLTAPGQLGLEVRDAAGESRPIPVALNPAADGRWRTTYAAVPPGNHRLAAFDRDPQLWLAFTQPVEVGRLTYWVPRLLRQGPLLMILAAGVAGLALLGGRIGTCGADDPGAESPATP
jgi:hypothetical protein